MRNGLKVAVGSAALLWASSGWAAPDMPMLLVDDPQGCVTEKKLEQELGAMLPEDKLHRDYKVTVVVAAPSATGTQDIRVKVKPPEAAGAPLERALSIQPTDCADAARLVARVVVKGLESAPAAANVYGNAAPGTETPAAKTSSEKVPDQWISFDRRVEVAVTTSRYGSSATVTDYEQPVLGPYKKDMAWPEFYDAVGKPDFAAQFKKNLLRRYALWGTGLGGALLGMLAASASGLSGLVAGGAGALLLVGALSASPLLGLGGGVLVAVGVALLVCAALALAVAAGGIGLTWLAVSLPVHPVEPQDIRKFADEHNQKLLEQPAER